MMIHGQDTTIERHAKDVRDVLTTQLSVKIKDLNKTPSKARKRLPKAVQKSVQRIADAEKRARHMPFISEGMKRAVAKDRDSVASYAQTVDLKSERKLARKRWLTNIFLSYSGFLLLLVGFWYVATQM